MSILDFKFQDEVWRLISRHLPHAGYSDMHYEAALAVLSDSLPRDRTKIRTCIGVDSNAEIGRFCDHDDPMILGIHGIGDRSARGSRFLAWAHGENFTLANTCFQKDFAHTWTHKSWQNCECRQIDFILVDMALKASIQDAMAIDDLGIVVSSDHRAVWAKIGPARVRKRRWTKRRPVLGWSLNTDQNDYEAHMTSAISSRTTLTAEELANVVAQTSMQHGEGRGRQAKCSTEEVIRLTSARKLAKSRQARA